MLRTGITLTGLVGMEAVLTFAAWLGIADAWTFAQTIPLSEGATLISTLGISGFLAWYCYYVTSTGIPKMQEQFRQELAETRAHYERVIEKILAEHKEAVAKMVDSCSHHQEAASRS